MNHKSGFILAAGFGTRMGQIGEVLPKPLWPFFDTHLIDLQRAILNKFGITDLVINTHHGHELVEGHFQKVQSVKLVNEREILGTGGALENAGKYFKWKNKVLMIANSDFFILNKFDEINGAINESEHLDGVMICFKSSGNQYSNLITNDSGNLIQIDKSKSGTESLCYSGYALVKINDTPSIATKKVIFDNYLDFKKLKIRCHVIEDLNFMDLGEKQFFVTQIKKIHAEIVSGKNSEQADFLVKHKILDPNKITSGGYFDEGKGFFNFTGSPVKHSYPKGSIILKEPQLRNSEIRTPAIVFDDLVDSILL